MPIECATNGSDPSSCFTDQCADNRSIFQLPLLQILASDTEAPTKLLYIIFVNILVFISIVNNLLSLQTCVYSTKIRITNVGIYLIGFTFTSLASTILMEFELYFNMQPTIVYNRRTILNDITIHLGLWLSSFIAVERVWIECFHQSLYASRKRALIVTILLFVLVVLTKLPIFIGRRPPVSSGNNLTPTATLGDNIFEYIHHVTPVALHFLSSLAVLCHISKHRIYMLGIKKRHYCSILGQQLDKHRDFFVPSLIYMLCNISYHIWSEGIYKVCRSDRTTSIRVYAALLLIVNIYYTFTFLIYIYPSRIYFEEFKHSSPVGKCFERLRSPRKPSSPEIFIVQR